MPALTSRKHESIAALNRLKLGRGLGPSRVHFAVTKGTQECFQKCGVLRPPLIEVSGRKTTTMPRPRQRLGTELLGITRLLGAKHWRLNSHRWFPSRCVCQVRQSRAKSLD